MSRGDALTAEQLSLDALAQHRSIGDWFKCDPEAAVSVVKAFSSGFTILDPSLYRRERSTNIGDTPTNARRIATPEGEFPSITAAVKHIGLSRQTITINLRTNKEGWRYL